MVFVKGKSGNPSGRPTRSDKHARPIATAEKRIADKLPDVIDNLFRLADGGWEQAQEVWEAAGTVTVGTGKDAPPAFPDLPADELVLVRRTVAVAGPDRAANQYLADRIMGKPTERNETDLTIDALQVTVKFDDASSDTD